MIAVPLLVLRDFLDIFIVICADAEAAEFAFALIIDVLSLAG